MLKRIIGIACTVIFTMVSLSAVFGDDKISVRVNNKDVSFSDQQPRIENGKVMVPLREAAEAMGISIDMRDRDGEAVMICTDDKKVLEIIDGRDEITVWDINTDKSDKNTVVVRGDSEKKTPLGEPIKFINGETLVPIRVFAESFGANIIWLKTTKTVEVFVSVDREELEKIFGLIGGLWKRIDLEISESDGVTKEMFKEVLSELLTYMEEVESSCYINQKTVGGAADELKKYLRRFEDFAKENGIDITAVEEDEKYTLKKFNELEVYDGEIIDISKNLEAGNRLSEMFLSISGKACCIEPKVRDEFMGIMEEITEYCFDLSNSDRPVNQKEADEITEKYEEYIAKLIDFAERNNIDINLD